MATTLSMCDVFIVLLHLGLRPANRLKPQLLRRHHQWVYLALYVRLEGSYPTTFVSPVPLDVPPVEVEKLRIRIQSMEACARVFASISDNRNSVDSEPE